MSLLKFGTCNFILTPTCLLCFPQHLTMRAYRKAQKAYQRRFTNPDGLTRSERDKLALLRKLDLLAQDASSAEYRKGIVNLAGKPHLFKKMCTSADPSNLRVAFAQCLTALAD